MRVVIAGAGNVGRSIARELIGNGHQVLLIDRDPLAIKTASVPDAEWLLADGAGGYACGTAIESGFSSPPSLISQRPTAATTMAVNMTLKTAQSVSLNCAVSFCGLPNPAFSRM